MVVWIARRFRTSVAWIEDRRENLIASAHGRDQRLLVRGGFAADGRLLALEGDIRCNVGAYSCYPVTCGVEPLMALAELPGPYDVRQYAVRARAVATNTCMMAPYRGVSRPVITLAMERLMDCAADQLGIDPVELRSRNLIRSFPYRSVTGLLFDEGSYLASLELAAAEIDLAGVSRAPAGGARARGAISASAFACSASAPATARPPLPRAAWRSRRATSGSRSRMDPSGYVEARIGASPHGQGLATTLAQLIADELGVEPAQIRIIHGDTDRTPYGWGTFASRSMVISGGACKLAAAALRDKLARLAGHLLEADPGDIEIAGGQCARARHRHGDRSRDARAPAPITSAIASATRTTRICRRRRPTIRPAPSPMPATSRSSRSIRRPGQVAIERFLVVEDAGVLINPMIAEGQVHGGVAQGIANALFEEIVYDGEGNILTASLADYLPPTCAEIPPIEIRHIVTDERCDPDPRQGPGRGRRDRRAGCGAERDLRCAEAVRGRRVRDAGDAAAHPRADPRRGGRGDRAMTTCKVALDVNGAALRRSRSSRAARSPMRSATTAA